MRYPSKKVLAEMDRKLRDAEGAQALPKDASYVDRVKFGLCQSMVRYLRVQRMAQIDLADKLEIDPARVSEIVHYRIDKFTIDTLLTYNRILDPKFELMIKSAI